MIRGDRKSPSESVIAAVKLFYRGSDVTGEVDKLIYPVTIFSAEVEFVAHGPAEMADFIRANQERFWAEGIRDVRCEPRSIVMAADHLAIVSARHVRLDGDGREMGAHHSTFILQHDGEDWRMRSVGAEDENDRGWVRQRLEELLRGLMLV